MTRHYAGGMDINWERVKQEAFTSIRREVAIDSLIVLCDEYDNETPVSGDMLTLTRSGR